MGAFFKPCRRKIGAVTLGLACALAAIWVHSSTHPKTFSMSLGNHKYFLIHLAENRVWIRETITAPMWTDETMLFHTDLWVVEVPHFVSTISLTLLSAYLLLSKPRSRVKPSAEETPGA